MPLVLKTIILSFCLSLFTLGANATEYSVFVKNNLKGLVDNEGNEIIPAEYDDIGWSRGSTHVVGRVIGYRKRNNWGLISTKNEKLTRAIYSYLVPFDKQLIIAGIRKDGTNRSTYFLINESGKPVSKQRYDYLAAAGNRLIAANNRGRGQLFGLVDAKQRTLISLQFSDISYLGASRYAVTTQPNAVALYDADGNDLTGPSFQFINPFDGTLAEAAKDGKLGQIDTGGNIVIPFAYRRMKPGENTGMPFPEWKLLTGQNELLATVKYDSVIPAGKNLYRARSLKGELIMNGSGKALTDYCSCHIASVYPEYALVRRDDKYGLLDREGTWVLPPSYDSLIVGKDFYLASSTTATRLTQWHMLDESGKELSEYGYQTMIYSESGLIPVKRRNLWGYIDRKGKEVIPAIYQKVEPYRFDMAVVDYMGAQGVIDRDGEWVISPKEGRVDILSENRFLVKTRWGNHICDRHRRPVYETEQQLSPFDSLHLLATTDEGKVGLLDFSGNMVLSTMYDAVSPLMQDTVYIFDKGEKRGLLSKSGKVMIPIENEFEEFHDMHDDFFGVRIGGKYGFVDVNGDLRIANRYDSIGHFTEGMAPIKLLGRWGYVDKIERLLVQPLYDEAYPFHDGMAIIKMKGKYGMINKEGDRVIEAKYDEIHRGPSGRIVVRLGDRYGLFSSSGETLIIPKYEKITDLPGEYVIIRRHGKYGVTTKAGRSTIPPIYDTITYDDINEIFLAVTEPEWENLPNQEGE
ncbi:WG repeat-containing protein [Roseivirga sp. BDSF3-8]|uniref:WG repeat-containing protein n=1 Tax=Roseivirga sp. BDSF3-8 TaxID=3241598 RepID=UPI0035324AE6